VNEMEQGYSEAADRIEMEIGAMEGVCLDVGCNTGDGALQLLKRWPATKWTGIDVRYDFVQVCRSKYLFATIMMMENLPWLEHFDFIFSRHSLEHCYNVQYTLNGLWKAGKVGSYIYFQIPIEVDGTTNKLHKSPFLDGEECHKLLSEKWTEVYWAPQPTVVEFIGKKASPASGK